MVEAAGVGLPRSSNTRMISRTRWLNRQETTEGRGADTKQVQQIRPRQLRFTKPDLTRTAHARQGGLTEIRRKRQPLPQLGSSCSACRPFVMTRSSLLSTVDRSGEADPDHRPAARLLATNERR